MTIPHGSSYLEPLTLWRMPLQMSILPLMACSTVQEYSILGLWMRTRYGGRLYSLAVQGIWRLQLGTEDRLLVMEGLQGWGVHPPAESFIDDKDSARDLHCLTGWNFLLLCCLISLGRDDVRNFLICCGKAKNFLADKFSRTGNKCTWAPVRCIFVIYGPILTNEVSFHSADRDEDHEMVVLTNKVLIDKLPSCRITGCATGTNTCAPIHPECLRLQALFMQ
jgi:hypothetical protein